MSAYDYKLTFKSGKENSNADCLSRFPAENKNKQSLLKNEVFLADLVNSPVTCKEVRDGTHKDPKLSRVFKYLQCGWPGGLDSLFDPFVRRKLEMSVEQECLVWGRRVIIPPNLRNKILKDLHEAHPGVSRMKTLARSYVW